MVVKTPFARIGDSGRVLHQYNCPRVDLAEDRREAGLRWGLPTYMTRDEATRYVAMWGHRACRSCDPVIAR